MKVREIHPIHTATTLSGRPLVTLYRAHVEKDGHEFPYFFFGRGNALPPPTPQEKRPDAVVIVAIVDDGDPRLVLVDEFRPAVGCREVSFPAGLIDPEDWASGTPGEAIRKAAVREFHEETGMELAAITEISPHNLYSTAGLTNESCVYVFGYAKGEPSTQFLEGSEDIEVILAVQGDLIEIPEQRVCSKTVWPFLWAFRRTGIKF